TRPAADETAAGATVEVVAGPTKPIEGTVRAKDTGKPLAGVMVYGAAWNVPARPAAWGPYAVTDDQGRYRILGLPKAGQYELLAVPDEGQGYLMIAQKVADSEGLKPLTLDFNLRRGVPVRLRLIDKETGQLVPGIICYEPTQDNPYRPEADFDRGVL